MTVRPATEAETSTVLGFFEEFADGSSKDLFDNEDVWIVGDGSSRGVTVASMDLTDLPTEVLEDMDHVGLRIGTLEGDDFHLDLQGAMLLATVTRDICVRVNEQAARMFAYGKDILAESILSWPRRVGKGDACIVVNPRWEAMGIGESLGKSSGMRPVVRPVHDLGAYLRDQTGVAAPKRPEPEED